MVGCVIDYRDRPTPVRPAESTKSFGLPFFRLIFRQILVACTYSGYIGTRALEKAPLGSDSPGLLEYTHHSIDRNIITGKASKSQATPSIQ